MAQMKRTYEITNQLEARGATLNALGVAEALLNAGKAVSLSVYEKKRTGAQNDHFHGQITDIFNAMKSVGSKRSFNWWKRALSEQFIAEFPDMEWSDNGVTPTLDGKRILQVFVPTSDFNVTQSRAFIEWLYAYGSEKGVTFLVDRRLEAQTRPSQRVAA